MAQAKQRPPAGKKQPTGQPAQPKSQPSQPAEQRLTAAERRAQRAAEVKQQQQRRRMRNLLIGLAAATAGAVILFFVIREQLALQGVGAAVPNEGAGHVNDGTPLTFAHIPPTSGKHYGTSQPAGIYPQQEISEGYWVHSLEHGYVVALVNCTDNCGPIFDQLRSIYDNNLKKSAFGNVKFIALKYTRPFTNGHTPPVTLVAWDHEMELSGVDKGQIERFYNKFVDKGPENVP